MPGGGGSGADGVCCPPPIIGKRVLNMKINAFLLTFKFYWVTDNTPRPKGHPSPQGNTRDLRQDGI